MIVVYALFCVSILLSQSFFFCLLDRHIILTLVILSVHMPTLVALNFHPKSMGPLRSGNQISDVII